MSDILNSTNVIQADINILYFPLASCANPGVPPNGKRVGKDFHHGQVVRFFCKRTYKLEGVSSLTCFDGNWSNGMPRCRGIRYLKVKRNGACGCFHSNFRIALNNLKCTLQPVYAFAIIQSETRYFAENIIRY